MSATFLEHESGIILFRQLGILTLLGKGLRLTYAGDTAKCSYFWDGEKAIVHGGSVGGLETRGLIRRIKYTCDSGKVSAEYKLTKSGQKLVRDAGIDVLR